jgi:hypothetical protein
LDATLLKSLVASAPVGLLIVGSIISLSRHRTVPAILQVSGALCLTIVIIAHVCEALHIFPRMGWGEEHSIGHYLDLTGAALGIILFPLGYLLQAMGKAGPAGK